MSVSEPILIKMVLQYKSSKDKRWKRYPGKEKIGGTVSKYRFRLLNEAKTKTLVEGNYTDVMKRFRAIEFFKRGR